MYTSSWFQFHAIIERSRCICLQHGGEGETGEVVDDLYFISIAVPTAIVHHQYPAQAIERQHPHPRRRKSSTTHPISPDLIPLHPLPRNRQLPPQSLENPLVQLRKAPVQILLVLLLRRRDLPHDLCRAGPAHLHLHRLVRLHPHVPVFKVVHIHFDRARQRLARWAQGVDGSPAAGPEVVQAVLVRDGHDGDGGVV